jgi:hypothetical protein
MKALEQIRSKTVLAITCMAERFKEALCGHQERDGNFANRIALITNRAGTNVFSFADTNAAMTGQRSYRARAP